MLATTKLRVYIAGPISKGDFLHNIQQADKAFFTLLKLGYAPFCPHWSVYAGASGRLGDGIGSFVYAKAETLPNGTTHNDWISVDLMWVEVADAVLRLPGYSLGADQEVDLALANDIPVYYSVEELVLDCHKRKIRDDDE
jgi:hypothetical protein